MDFKESKLPVGVEMHKLNYTPNTKDGICERVHKYDQLIKEKTDRIATLLSFGSSSQLLKSVDFRSQGFIDRKIVENFIENAIGHEARLWESITSQIRKFPARRTGDITVLIPVYNEPPELVERAVRAAKTFHGEILVLINNAENDSLEIVEKNRQLFSLEILNNDAGGDESRVLVLDATMGLGLPGIGSARAVLLAADAYRSLVTSSSKNIPGRKLIMTDCDCEMSERLSSWIDEIFYEYPETLAIPLNIEFSPDNDRTLSEGIEDTEHLRQLMLGEFIRNVFVASGGFESHREERRWIGMGMAFTLQAAVISGGFPAGWKRKEDHYIGAMFEILEQLRLGSVYNPDRNAPAVVSMIRGSERTDASLGKALSTFGGCSGLEHLYILAQTTSKKRLIECYSKLRGEQRQTVLNMPTTKLLINLLMQLNQHSITEEKFHQSEIFEAAYRILTPYR